jgi:putative Mg2+ transporter-C (MgtC) family protein
VIRLLFSAALGAVVGIQREHSGKPAGLRTHMLVALGSTLFVLVPLETGMQLADTSRVVQGSRPHRLHRRRRHPQALERAGSARHHDRRRDLDDRRRGVAVGTGRLGIAAISIAFTWIILAIVGRIEARLEQLGKIARDALDRNPHDRA